MRSPARIRINDHSPTPPWFSWRSGCSEDRVFGGPFHGLCFDGHSPPPHSSCQIMQNSHVTESRCLELCVNPSHWGHWVNVKEPRPSPCPDTPTFHNQGSQCWFCNPQARKLIEDSGCVCLFYYHRLLIVREVRGLASISSNCCESLWASTDAHSSAQNISCTEAGAWGAGQYAKLSQSFPTLPSLLCHFSPSFSKCILKCRAIQ